MVKVPYGISEKAIWNTTLSAPDEIQDLLLGESTRLYDLVGRGDPAKGVPFLLYCETRDEDNYLRSHSLFSNEDHAKIEEMHAGREVLGKTDWENVGLYGYEEKWRGVVLGRFCKIDFILDVLICIENGYYTNPIQTKKIMRELRDWDGLFSTTDKKLRYLRSRKVISEPTYSFLNEAKHIRNNFAHQYIPKSPLVSDKDVEQFGSFQLAIITIYNFGWHFLMTDFVGKQKPIYMWLKEKNHG